MTETENENFADNCAYNILRLLDILSNFPFTTSVMKHDC